MKTKEQLAEELAARVNAAPLGKLVIEDLQHIFEYVSFSLNDGEYCWIACYSWKNRRTTGYAHPLISQNVVQTFKTFAGAKRSFLRKYSDEWAFVS